MCTKRKTCHLQLKLLFVTIIGTNNRHFDYIMLFALLQSQTTSYK